MPSPPVTSFESNALVRALQARAAEAAAEAAARAEQEAMAAAAEAELEALEAEVAEV